MRSNQNLVYGTFSFGSFHKTNPYYAMVALTFKHSHHTLFTASLWPTATLKSKILVRTQWNHFNFLDFYYKRRMCLDSSLRAVTFGWRSWGNTWAFSPLFRLLILRWSPHLFCRSFQLSCRSVLLLCRSFIGKKYFFTFVIWVMPTAIASHNIVMTLPTLPCGLTDVMNEDLTSFSLAG